MFLLKIIFRNERFYFKMYFTTENHKILFYYRKSQNISQGKKKHLTIEDNVRYVLNVIIRHTLGLIQTSISKKFVVLMQKNARDSLNCITLLFQFFVTVNNCIFNKTIPYGNYCLNL